MSNKSGRPGRPLISRTLWKKNYYRNTQSIAVTLNGVSKRRPGNSGMPPIRPGPSHKNPIPRRTELSADGRASLAQPKELPCARNWIGDGVLTVDHHG